MVSMINKLQHPETDNRSDSTQDKSKQEGQINRDTRMEQKEIQATLWSRRIKSKLPAQTRKEQFPEVRQHICDLFQES